MLNHDSLTTLAAAQLDPILDPDPNWLAPHYGSYCFAGIPQLTRACLVESERLGLPAAVLGSLPRRYDRVLTILVDGFGWQAFERASELRYLARMLDEGVASKLSSQFPSTTAAHVTTLHTGVPVGQSGVFEWFYYEPQLERLFSPLIYKTVEGAELELLERAPMELFPKRSFYLELARAGVRSACLMRAHCIDSPFSRTVCRGAQAIAFEDPASAITKLGQWFEAEPGPAHACLYLDELDAAGHRHGPESDTYADTLARLMVEFESRLHPLLASLPGRSLVLMTADHGQLQVEAESTIYLDRELPRLTRWLRCDGLGRPLRPGGSPRDLFLCVQAQHLDEARAALSTALEGRALVVPTSALLDTGLFGPHPSATLRARLGELAILPRANHMIWWAGEGEGLVRKCGHHGGLSRAEMEIPLLALAYE